MKKVLITTLFTIFFFYLCYAQAPQSFKYQAVVRDNAGNILISQTIGFKVSILQNSSTGTVVYSEEHTTTTNQFGMVNINIGSGSNPVGVFSTIDWGNDSYYIQVEIDISGGSSYTLMGSSKLLSVPYALYSASGTGQPGVGIVSTTDNGDGTLTFNYSDSTSFTTSDLTGTQGIQGDAGADGSGISDFAIFTDQKPGGTNAGDSDNGTYVVRTLNTTITNQGTSISLSGNVITLKAGNYLFEATVPAGNVGNHKAILYNNSSLSTEIIGSNATDSETSIIKGYFSVTGSNQNFEIRQFFQSTVTGSGLGIACGFASIDEVYTQVKIMKLNPASGAGSSSSVNGINYTIRGF